MAIAFDKSGAQYTPASATSTLNMAASASNEVAIIFTWNGNGSDLVSVTVGGVAATKITSANVFGTQWMGVYYFANPSTSAIDYVATATNSADDVEIGVALYSGADTVSIPDSSNLATGNTSGASSPFQGAGSTTVVASNCWVVCATRGQLDGPPNHATPFVNATKLATAGSAFYMADTNGTVATGSYTITGQWTRDQNYGMPIVSIDPVATATTVKVKPTLLLLGIG